MCSLSLQARSISLTERKYHKELDKQRRGSKSANDASSEKITTSSDFSPTENAELDIDLIHSNDLVFFKDTHGFNNDNSNNDIENKLMKLEVFDCDSSAYNFFV